MDCEDEIIKYIKIKPLRVKVKRLRQDPETIRMWKKQLEKDADVIEISDDDETNTSGVGDTKTEKNNNLDNKSAATSSKSQSIKYEECYEFIGFNKKEEESLVIEKQRTDICEELVLSSPKVTGGGEKRRRKSVSPRVVDGNLKSNSNSGHVSETEVGPGGPHFKKERKALLQKLRQQEISKMKKDLRDKLPDQIKSTTKLSASSLSEGLKVYIEDLQAETDRLQFEFHREERQNFILRRKLADLTEDKSTWPYEITETSDKITIRKQCDHFVF